MAQDTCVLRRAAPADAPRIEAFLAAHAATSMFLRSNLAAHGLGPSDAAHATEMFVHEDADRVHGVIGLTNGGYLMAQLADGSVDLSAARAHWQGRRVVGMTGLPNQVAHVLMAMGLADTQTTVDHDEPLFQLDLSDLAGPFDTLRVPQPSDREMLENWFFDYLCDTGASDSDLSTRADAVARAKRAVAGDTVRLLEVDALPVAMTAFNAEVAGMVQVGGVFVPRALRNKGYGRRVVAAHLAEARARGIGRAILFAASDDAARAYRAIGFEQIGTYRVALFKKAATIEGAI
ncbi:GNAT family N-acetyltransferase [uncultured Tateyamaria sp.]|uniref:GNAT family N-acetyltransferase n=1 Tax=uncultured Tateyamaria sp. TaxID=455651 RepID=UPI0026322A36|nr:GNAT family N-acetyltransferase [uncultured Tateyamaria sp.]